MSKITNGLFVAVECYLVIQVIHNAIIGKQGYKYNPILNGPDKTKYNFLRFTINHFKFLQIHFLDEIINETTHSF